MKITLKRVISPISSFCPREKRDFLFFFYFFSLAAFTITKLNSFNLTRSRVWHWAGIFGQRASRSCSVPPAVMGWGGLGPGVPAWWGAGSPAPAWWSGQGGQLSHSPQQAPGWVQPALYRCGDVQSGIPQLRHLANRLRHNSSVM